MGQPTPTTMFTVKTVCVTHVQTQSWTLSPTCQGSLLLSWCVLYTRTQLLDCAVCMHFHPNTWLGDGAMLHLCETNQVRPGVDLLNENEWVSSVWKETKHLITNIHKHQTYKVNPIQQCYYCPEWLYVCASLSGARAGDVYKQLDVPVLCLETEGRHVCVIKPICK